MFIRVEISTVPPQIMYALYEQFKLNVNHFKLPLLLAPHLIVFQQYLQ